MVIMAELHKSPKPAAAITPPSVFLLQCLSTKHPVKNFTEFIDHYKYFSIFVFGEHSDKNMFTIQYYKSSTFIANH